MLRHVTATVISVSALLAQAPEAKYKFEVASIRPAPSDARGTQISVQPGSFGMRNANVQFMIQYAYKLQPSQIDGGPPWVRDARFDITATDSEVPGTPSPDERTLLRMRALLEERFKLVLKQETRDINVFALVIDSKGSKLKPAAAERGSTTVNRSNGNGTMRGDGITTQRLAEALVFVDRPVVDETGLKGFFDFELVWSDSTRPDAPNPSIFTALREQLGLKLEPKKRALPVSVIEAVQMPSEN